MPFLGELLVFLWSCRRAPVRGRVGNTARHECIRIALWPTFQGARVPSDGRAGGRGDGMRV